METAETEEAIIVGNTSVRTNDALLVCVLMTEAKKKKKKADR